MAEDVAEDIHEWLALYLLDADGQVVRVTDDGSGVPLVVQWALALTDDMRRVAVDEANGLAVSTVFLGMDCYALLAKRAPHVFETAVFSHARPARSLDDMPGCVWRRNTCTLDEAQRTHQEALRLVRTGRITADSGDA